MEFFIKTIKSVSDYFARVDNGDNPNVEIRITETNEKGQEGRKHLIITGINGTGKTVLLERISQELRKKFIEVTGYELDIWSVRIICKFPHLWVAFGGCLVGYSRRYLFG